MPPSTGPRERDDPGRRADGFDLGPGSDPLDFLILALNSARETLAYLFAYFGVPVWAFLAAAILAVLDPARRWSGGDARLARRSGPLRIAASFLDGAASLPWRPDFGSRLRDAAATGPLGLVLFLAASHGLNVYVLFLLGPLMGKDVLLTHVAGVVVWSGVAAGLWFRFGGARHPDGKSPPDRSVSILEAVGEELRGGVPALLYGLVLGSVVAAWGLGSPDFLPAHLVAPAPAAQAINAAAGIAVAALLAIPPVGNLFVATYLWKVGLAHAGLVAFLAAAPVSLVRIRTYRRIFGVRETRRLTAVFVVAALIAGLAIAALWGALGLEIRYKLVPGQMWRF